MHLWQVPLERVQHRVGAEHEDPGIPGVRRILEVPPGGRGVRLLHERFHREHPRRLLRSPPQIPVAGLRTRGLDPERQQIAVLAGARSESEGVAEGIRTPHVMIAGQHHQGGGAVLAQRVHAGKPDRGRGIARHRLDDQMRRRQIGKRCAHAFDVILAAHHPRALARAERRNPRERLRDQGPLRHQRQELLGLLHPRERPEPRPAAAGENHRVQAHCPSRASWISWLRMRAVAPQTTAPFTVYQ